MCGIWNICRGKMVFHFKEGKKMAEDNFQQPEIIKLFLTLHEMFYTFCVLLPFTQYAEINMNTKKTTTTKKGNKGNHIKAKEEK